MEPTLCLLSVESSLPFPNIKMYSFPFISVSEQAVILAGARKVNRSVKLCIKNLWRWRLWGPSLSALEPGGAQEGTATSHQLTVYLPWIWPPAKILLLGGRVKRLFLSHIECCAAPFQQVPPCRTGLSCFTFWSPALAMGVWASRGSAFLLRGSPWTWTLIGQNALSDSLL